MGNTTLTLPKGVVCDKCNNYYARKIEAPILNSTELKALRFKEAIPNKKGIIPPVSGIMNGVPVSLHRISFDSHDLQQFEVMVSFDPKDYNQVVNAESIITPAFTDDTDVKNSIILSRFIAKIALEALAERVIKAEGWESFIIDNSSFDPIRNYARRGGFIEWPCKIRRIYGIDQQFVRNGDNLVQIIHECDFLLIPSDQDNIYESDEISAFCYFIVALWGLEFTINMAGPDEDGLQMYDKWLTEHDSVSPLYWRKKQEN